MVGRVIGYFFLALLAFFILFLLVPVTIYVEYANGAVALKVRILFVKIGLLPAKPRAKPKKEKKPKSNTNRKQKPKKEKPKKSFEEILQFIKRIASAATRATKVIFRFLYIRDVQLVLPVSGADAAAAAIACGRMQALVGGTRAVLSNVTNLHCKRLLIVPDFAGQYAKRLSFSCKIVASPVIMVAAGIVGIKRFLLYKPVAYSKAEYVRAQRANTNTT